MTIALGSRWARLVSHRAEFTHPQLRGWRYNESDGDGVHCQGVCGIRYEHVLKPPIHLPDVSHRTYNLQTYLTP